MAGEASAGRAGLHSSGSVLAESAGSVVASVQKGGISGPDLCQRRTDRESSADCNPATQLQSEAVGVGPSAEAPKASAAFLCLPSLRNGALRPRAESRAYPSLRARTRPPVCSLQQDEPEPRPETHCLGAVFGPELRVY